MLKTAHGYSQSNDSGWAPGAHLRIRERIYEQDCNEKPKASTLNDRIEGQVIFSYGEANYPLLSSLRWPARSA